MSVEILRDIKIKGTSLSVHWLRLHLPMQEVWVQSLVEELRSHMTQGQKKQNVKQTQYCNKFNKDLDKKVYVLSMCTVQGMVNYHTKYSKQESTLSWQ